MWKFILFVALPSILIIIAVIYTHSDEDIDGTDGHKDYF